MLRVDIRPKREKLWKTIELFKLGHSFHEIAKMLGKSREGVRIQLEGVGLLPKSDTKYIPMRGQVLRGKVRWNSPYGFQYTRGRAHRHPQEHQTFLMIMELSKAGFNPRQIADELNDKRLRPRTAKRWDRCTVHRILKWHERYSKFIQEALAWEPKS